MRFSPADEGLVSWGQEQGQMARLSWMRCRLDFISSGRICVDLVQSLVIPCFNVHMFCRIWDNSPEVGVIDIPCHNKNTLRASVLLLADGVMVDIDSCNKDC